MAMHKSEELAEVSLILFEQVEKLGIKTWSTGFNVWLEGDTSYIDWVVNSASRKFIEPYKVDLSVHPSFMEISSAKKQGDDFFVHETEGETLEELYRLLFQMAKTQFEDIVKAGFQLPEHQFNHYVFGSKVSLMFITFDPCPEAHEIFKRFGKVFEQTYTRFLDLQKAEEQAREAEIQLALERVRARTMAMHRSEELGEVAILLYKEFNALKMGDFFNCGFVIVNEADSVQNGWMTQPEGTFIEELDLPYPGDVVLKKRAKAWKEGTPVFCDKVSGEKLEIHIKYVRDHSKSANQVNTQLPYMPDPCYFYCGNFAQGYLHILAKEELRPEDEVVLSRFTKVFEQTYTRFLDLQRAEAQAREAQIEVSLERVRSRAMAMHKSEELGEVAELLYKELQKLGITDFINCGYIEVDEQNKTQYGWITNSEGKAMERFYLPLVGESVLDDRYEARMRKDPIFCQTVAGEMLKEHLRFVSPQLGSEEALQNAVNNFPDPTIFYCGNFSHGYLCIITGTPLTSEKEALLARFTRVFEMTYKRFLDLQKAEEQAREAQIEAALERIRSRSMAMHKSEELSEVAVLLYEELKGLGLTQFFNCGYVEVRESENRQYVYTSTFEGKWAEGHTIPLTGDKIFDARYKAWKSQVPVFQQIVGGMKLKKHLEYSSPPASVIEITSNFPDPSVFYCCNFSKGYLHIITEAQLNDEAESLLGRFAKVFEQTYTRFLDLQKAEAQAKEAEIELALERVRARTMAMHHSDELIEVVKTLNKQFLELRPESVANWLSLVNVESNSMKIIGSVMNGLLQEYIANGSELPSYQNDLDEFKKGIPHWQFSLPKEEILRIWRESFEFDEADLPEGVTKYHLLHIRHTFGFYGFGSWEKADEETIAILSRFCKVFEQTYTRFLDLQKAEAQAREAEIELALERVRAKTMAMQKSDELSDVAALLFKQIKILGAELWTISIAFCKEDGLIVEKWGGSPITDQIFAPNFIPYNADHGEQSMYNTWKNKVELYSYVQEGKELKDIYDHLMTIPSFKANFQKVIDSGRPLPVWQKNHVASFKYGYLLVITEEEFKEEYVFTRFAKVFEQTYTRFLDLQKAEAQTREAQIEAALERVRSRSMAMHNSEDLIHVATEMNQQFNKLGITQSLQAGFVLLDEEKELQYLWGGQTDSKLLEFITIPLFGDHVLQTRYEAWKRKDPVLNTVLASEDLRKHMEVVMPAKGLSEREMEASNSMPDPCYFCCGNFKYGYLIVISTDVLTEEQHKIVARMAKVFEQTYTRFLDLQKAEAQAREAQIQLSLERVRARAMAMHKSEELSEVATALYKELRSLAFAYPFFNCGYVEVDEKNKTQHGWMTTPNGDFLERFNLPLVGDGVLQTRYAAWKQKTPVFCQKVGGSELKNHIKFVTPNFGAERMVEMVRTEFPDSVFFNCGNFSNGYLHVVTGTQISASEELLLARFTQAFEMTYTRFLDLQKAEARERDAIKQASVDRVRAEIASMRTTTDLERITPLIWNELTTLGVPFIRCGVFIMDEENQQVQTHLSTPDGKAIAAFQLNYEATNQSRQIVSHWREKKIFKDHMDEVAFAEYTKNLVQQGAISSNEKYVTENRPTDLYLHFLPFLQGMLYVGNDAPLKQDELHLVQNLAEAFSTAYARYEDFKKLELAKSAVESAMIELKATQTQLIQQEKLASLGQLTAGIAHEIKNPLNFVNNFSEVSIEMIEEVQEERIKSPASRDEGLVDEILVDIKSNLRKVHEHGTRANGIVSSMLQHSRGGSGKMEPTDLNALIKEYVNLSFHGMRAGKNPINVDIRLDLDEKIGSVNLIGEDFSRVVLNLVNNAFDAMREKTKTEPDYKPVLSIYTRSNRQKMLLKFPSPITAPASPMKSKTKSCSLSLLPKKGQREQVLG
jgi:signal transduction histidine kinase